ncbi:MAG TPA: hypothetical protein VGQ57_01980 [Polyangiaceae bacterium]|nr:hypothetical protein [Polyangiaceae bacterium]
MGLELLYHTRPERRLDPWLGLGAGYEWLTLTETTTGVGTFGLVQPHNQAVGWTSHGFEFFNLQVGLDVLVVGPLAVGPFVTLTVAHFRRVNASCSGDCDSTGVIADPPDGDVHDWLYGGARTTLVF